jgi:nitroreductase
MDDLFNPLATLCARRRSVRTFADRPVPAHLIEKIERIARTSPYASGRKNWQLRFVTDPAKMTEMSTLISERISRLASSLQDDFRDEFTNYALSFSAVTAAPLLIIPIFRTFGTFAYMLRDPHPELEQWERDNYVKSIACVSMLVLLAAESLGLGACMMTGPLIAEPSLKSALGIRQSQQIGAIIPVGFPVEARREEPNEH